MPGVAIGVDRWRRHHEVSILIAAGGAGRYFGSQPRAKVSMMIMRLPQHGHGRGSARGCSSAASGGKYPDTMPQAIKQIDAEGRSCIYVPIAQDGKVVDSQGFVLDAEDE